MESGSTLRRPRPLVALVLLLSLIIPVTAIAAPPTAFQQKVEPVVQTQLATEKEADVWLVLRAQANLAPAYEIEDWEARGRFVAAELQATANRSQAALRALLTTRGKSHRAFWIVNAIKVTADATLVDELARRPEVAQIVGDRTLRIPEPLPATTQAGVNDVEWGIDRINAPRVWDEFAVRGEGIVVANIDTGVEYTHPALVNQYRGNLGEGTFDHNYNWYDPTLRCGNPSLEPCDTDGHGTHTMGTIVGDDGDTNQIGVAPGATWIAVKGCATLECSEDTLLAAGQWVLAPTDLNGANPLAELRPHIVNNSWGGGSGSLFYAAIIDAWLASGIFPQFANGNAGPYCGSAGSPGDNANTYAAGAFDSSNSIASFSSRGPSAFGGIKPNIAAPGVDIRSSVPGGYEVHSGTSMASPHVAGTVALMWAAAPALIGEVDATRALLDQTAIDVEDTSCGGDAALNNVWGEGRLDAFAAVEQSPRGPTGTLTGTVTDAALNPLTGVTVHIAGSFSRTLTTGADGTYRVVLPIGTFEVTASSFGFISATAGTTVSEGSETTLDFTLEAAPAYEVTGTVTDEEGTAVAGASVTLLDTPIAPATTDTNGSYTFPSVPLGTYAVKVAQSGCYEALTLSLTVEDTTTFDVTLPRHVDEFGYFCRTEAPAYVEGDTRIELVGDDNGIQVSLPFPFSFYGVSYETAFITTNGYVSFVDTTVSLGNTAIPSSAPPNGAIYAFWDDLLVAEDSGIYTRLLDEEGRRGFVIEWRNVHFCCDYAASFDAEVVLYANGEILMQYRNIDPEGRESGDSATIGIENELGTVGLQYGYDQPVLDASVAVRYDLPPSGSVEGTVTDANDNEPIAGATVRALQDGSPVREARADAAGRYHLMVPVGVYDIVASAEHYTSQTLTGVEIADGQRLSGDFVLTTARAVITPDTLALLVPVGQTVTRTLTLSNTGSVEMAWAIRESGGSRVSAARAAASMSIQSHDANAMTTQGMSEDREMDAWSPTAVGDVLKSWSSSSIDVAWGVGYTGNVWLSDAPNRRNHEFTADGAQTGRSWPLLGTAEWIADLAYDAGRGLMCQLNVGGDNGIHCWDPNTGVEGGSITGSFPWTAISQRGLAYRPDDDSFYVGGWNEGIIYHIAGLGHAQPGTVLGQCSPPDLTIAGLAWNPAYNVLWQATNSSTDTLYQLNPATCMVLGTLPHPRPYYNGAGLEMNEDGNLWMIGQSTDTVYLVESGVPSYNDVPWLVASPAGGTLAEGGTQNIQVTVNTTGMEAGIYNAVLVVQSNSGRQPFLRVPISLVVPAYAQNVNAGGKAFTDQAGQIWAADRRWAPGGWGYTNAAARASSTRRPIANTDDDGLYQTVRSNPVEYRFDGLPAGVYQVDLHFADLTSKQADVRLFHIYIENALALPAYDIVGVVGPLAADRHTFLVTVSDGQLNIRFAPYGRGYQPPIVNAIKVLHRPDR